jgi:hypothetical protein
MHPDTSVVADPAAGMARLGALQVEMSSAGASGEVRFCGAGGTVLRPLRFSERTELVTAAAAQASPRDAVAASVLAAATVERGRGARDVLEILALWLAGAAWDAPPFLDTTLVVGRAAGWSLQDLLGAHATEVDRLAVHLAEQERGGWNAIVFLPPPAEELSDIRARFADQLLRRSAAGRASESAPATARRARESNGGARAEAPRPQPEPRRTGLRVVRTDGVNVPRRPARAESHVLPRAGSRADRGTSTEVSARQTEVSARQEESANELPQDVAGQHPHGMPVRRGDAALPVHGLQASSPLTVHTGVAAPQMARVPAGGLDLESFSPAMAIRHALAADVVPAAPGVQGATAATALRTTPQQIAETPAAFEPFALAPTDPGIWKQESPLLFDSRRHAVAGAASSFSGDLRRENAFDEGADPLELARTLAAMLEDEADLRGVER